MTDNFKYKNISEESLSNNDELDEENSNKNLFKVKPSNKKVISKSTLESIKENDSINQGFPKSASSNCFGIKSYLHEFYDQNSIQSIDERNYYYERRRLKNKRLRFLWKMSFWFGVGLLLIGLSMLVVGYALNEKSIIVAQSNNIEIVDNSAIHFNRNLEACKIFGLLLFSLGGLVLACSLIAPSFICYEECLYNNDDFYEQAPININYSEYDKEMKTSIDLKKAMEFRHIQPQSFKAHNFSKYSFIQNKPIIY